MNILGKVLVWTIVVLAPVGLTLSARALQVRNSWTQKVFREGGPKEEAVANAKKIAELTTKRQNLETDLALTLLGWDQYWSGVPVNTVNAEEGKISAQLPANFIVPKNTEGEDILPVLYGFKINNNGDAQYVGPFRMESFGNPSVLAASWRFRANETANWNGNWRFRSMIPTAHKERLQQLDLFFTRADELLETKEENLALQEQLAETAQEQLDLRMKELVLGNEALEDNREKLAPEFVDGLVAAIKKAAQERNAVAAEVDHLRRELKVAYEDFLKLKASNIDLVENLVRSKQPVAAK